MLLIFDFDGVIADSEEAHLSAFKKVLKKYGFKPKDNQIRKAFGGIAREVITNLLGKKANEKLIEKISKEQIELLYSSIGKIKPLCNRTLLKNLKKNNKMVLRTNTSRKSVIKFFKDNALDIFDEIITPERKMEKEEALRYYLKKYGGSAVYVGDMVSDVRAAKKVGIVSVAIPGWHSKKMLKKERPGYLIYNLKELPKLLKMIDLKK